MYLSQIRKKRTVLWNSLNNRLKLLGATWCLLATKLITLNLDLLVNSRNIVCTWFCVLQERRKELKILLTNCPTQIFNYFFWQFNNGNTVLQQHRLPLCKQAAQGLQIFSNPGFQKAYFFVELSFSVDSKLTTPLMYSHTVWSENKYSMHNSR